MAYTKHTWVCGEVINDAKMNNIETGIEEALECCGGGAEPLIVHNYSEAPFDKTWQEIYDAINAGRTVFVVRETAGSLQVSSALTLISGGSGNDYQVRVVYARDDHTADSQVLSYFAETADDYPIID